MVVVVNEQVKPEDGATVVARVTVPENPFIAVNVMVEVPPTPARTVRLVGLAPIVKSCTL